MTVNGLKIFEFDQVSSTFSVAKELLKQHEKGVVIAKSQTCGKGKGERKFVSNDGGLYFTIFYKNLQFNPSFALKSVINAGLSVYDVLVSLGFDAKLKWPNDVLINGKKVCGILCETLTCADKTDFMCGVGINVNTTCFDEFEDIATSLFLQNGAKVDINQFAKTVIQKVLQNLFDESDKQIQFFNASKMLGKTVLVTDVNESYKVQINGLSQDGFLCGLRDGVQTKIICGDVKEV
ncbi:MAG: biotin--[acetyl-CoA-carboxylase] ligase [Clostridiales bacterium]|nr:biotin--[acetyl-CoA-carboxylase] ligase [Clostridiales bacterium]